MNSNSPSKIQLTGLIAGVVVLTAFLASSPPEGMSPMAMKAAGITLLVAIWWVTEALPIAVTAFVPLILFPLFGIMDTKETASNYGHPYVWMLLGGFILAKSIEIHNLHKRIALSIINLIGTQKKVIILSFMAATAFLSMWIANVAVALMMLPIALAVIKREESDSAFVPGQDKFGVALMLAIAYSSTIGGMSTLIGTPTNMVFAGMAKELYPDAPEVTFFQWMAVGIPLMVVLLPITWFYLLKYFKVSGNFSQGHDVIKEELHSIGPMSTPEKRVLAIFVLTSLGWIFRSDLEFDAFTIPGWASLMGIDKYVHDATVAIFFTILLFIIPAGYKKDDKRAVKSSKLMDWKQAEDVPWGVVIIVGGGYAIAQSFTETGLANWIGSELSFIGTLPVIVVMLLVVTFISFVTEVNSNTATANIFLPVLAVMAVAGGAHPFLLMIPGTFAASCSFMLPSGTGTNAVVFGSGRVTIPQMASAGLWLNFIAIIILTIAMYTLAAPVFGITKDIPIWAK